MMDTNTTIFPRSLNPNKETRHAMREARERKNMESFDSVKEWVQKLYLEHLRNI